MTWSETSTANTSSPSCSPGRFSRRIAYQLAQYAARGQKNVRQPRRQIVKRDGGSEQGVEGRIGQQLERGREAPARRPPRPMGRRNPSDLARNQPQPPAVEGAAEGNRDL